ncbi:MAG: hypothetical protein IJV90_01330 [Candidatus Methanomethylophilaceae archaeon]|nr:hypothetical protein [Candidatus Methanomethylophilaceae archaeon]
MAEEMTLNEHHSEVMNKLCDIDKDTDALIAMEGKEAMSGAYDSGMLAGMLANKNDNNDLWAYLANCRNNGWGDGDGLMFLLLVLLMGGGGFGGWGNRGLDGVAGVDRTVVNTSNYEMLHQAINGNAQAMQTLASSLNCSLDQIQNALCGVDKQIAISEGNLMHAYDRCCCNIQNKILESKYETSKQMSEGFCGTNLNIERMQNSIERRQDRCCCETQQAIQGVNYNLASQFAAQTAFIQGQFCEQNAYLAKEFTDIKLREDAKTITELRDKLADAKADARALATVSAVNASRPFTGTLDATSGAFTGNLSQNVFP